MKYALLINMGDGIYDQLPKSTKDSFAERHRKLNLDIRAAGHFEGSVRLVGPQVATRVVTRGAEQIVVDGPYPETKEFLVGFYLLDCPGLEDAIAYARRIPVGPLGSVEIRPVAYVNLP